MTDLENLRSWRRAAPNRVLRLLGLDGKNGVELISFANGTRNRARYDSVGVAATALAAGRVRFKPYADIVPEPPRYGRPLLGKRARGRR
jgi:hypothetical protein